MSFQKLRAATDFRAELLPFVVSIVDHDILIAIGLANELKEPVGYKQLKELTLTSPTTLQRKIQSLLEDGFITRTNLADDNRRVNYTLSTTTLLAYKKYIAKISALTS
jgi:DNA-binding MarR family transcriptional regulator